MVYYGPAHMVPGYGTDPVAKHLEKFVFPDSVQGLPSLKDKVNDLAQRWEHAKIRFSFEGKSPYSAEVENELLEHGKAMLWDHNLKNSPLSLQARFQATVR